MIKKARLLIFVFFQSILKEIRKGHMSNKRFIGRYVDVEIERRNWAKKTNVIIIGEKNIGTGIRKVREQIIFYVPDTMFASWLGFKSFESKTNIRIERESSYIFYDIKNGKIPIFILNKPLRASTNNLTEVEIEPLYKSGGSKYYYMYKGKKYTQKDRYDRNFGIYTRAYTPIYPYVTLKELKPRLKVRGFKRIAKRIGTNNYVLKPFNLTHQEKKLKRGK